MTGDLGDNPRWQPIQISKFWGLWGTKLFCVLWNLLEIKKSDEFHVVMLFLNWIEFRFWGESLIRQFILEVTFSFDWDLCGDRYPIAQAGGA